MGLRLRSEHPCVGSRMKNRAAALWFVTTGVTFLAFAGLGCSPPKPDNTVAPQVGAHASVDGGVSTADATREADASGSRVVWGCYAVTCSDGLELRVTLPVPATDLAKANVALEVDGEAIPAGMPIPVNQSEGWGGKQDPPCNATSRVLRLSPLFSQLRIDVSLREGLPGGGTTFSLEVDTPARGTVLDLTRTVFAVPRGEHPAGPWCGDPCKYATARLYEDSASDLTCGGLPCMAGLQLYLHAPRIAAQLNNATVRVCRNKDCAHRLIQGFPTRTAHRTGGLYHVPFEKPLFPSELVGNWANPDVLVFNIKTDPVVLANHDRYTFTFRKDGRTLGHLEKVVTSYDASYPNGPACDLVPCLRKVVHATM